MRTANTFERSNTSLFETTSRLWDGVRTLGIGVTLQAILYPYRKAYHSGRFTHVRGAQRTTGSVTRGIAAVVDKRSPPKKIQPTEYLFPGRVLAHQRLASAKGIQRQHVELTCENAMVQIAVLAPDLMRVRVSPEGRLPIRCLRKSVAPYGWQPCAISVSPQGDLFVADGLPLPPFSYAIVKNDAEWEPVEFTVKETPEALTIRTSRLHCRIAKAHLAITFLDPDGTVINLCDLWSPPTPLASAGSRRAKRACAGNVCPPASTCTA